MFFLLDPYSEGGGHEEEWTDPTTGCTAGVSNRGGFFYDPGTLYED